MTKKPIEIERVLFHNAYSRESSFFNRGEFLYINKNTGDVIPIYDLDEAADCHGLNPAENKFHREQKEKYPEQYILINRMFWEDHQSILLLFLDSNWTRNKKLKMLVKNCYQNSISGWMKNIRIMDQIDIGPETIIDSWYRFKNDELNIRMEKYLKDNNIDFQWC